MKIYLETRISVMGGSAPASRIRSYCYAWIKEGLSCEVISIKQLRSETKIKSGIYQNIPYKYVGRGLISNNKYNPLRYIGYIIDDISALLYLIKYLKKDDILFIYGFTIFHTFLSIWIAHKKHCKVFVDLCEYPFGTGKESYSRRLQRYIFIKYQIKLYDGIFPISEALENFAKQYAKDSCVILRVPILVDYDRYNIESKISEVNIPYIFHTGTLYEQKDGILGMIEAFGLALKKMNKTVNYVLTGSIDKSPHSREIRSLINKYKLEERIQFVGYITDEELKNYLQGASFVIINKAPNQQNRFCFSTKLGEYMAAGKAVIITDVGEAINWLSNDKDAIIIPPLDLNCLADTIVKLFSNQEKLLYLGNNARETCRRCFDYRSWGNAMNNSFRSSLCQ